MNSHLSIKPVILPAQKRPDGTYNVKIRITFKRVSRIIATQLTARADDVTKTRPVKLRQNTNTWVAAIGLVGQMYDATDSLSPISMEYMEVDDIVRWVRLRLASKPDGFRLDFFEYAERYSNTRDPGTKKVINIALNAFKTYLGRVKVDISEISSQMVLGFYDWAKETRKELTAWNYTKRLQTIYNAAKYEYNDEDAGMIVIPKNPFQKLRNAPHPTPARTAKDVEFIQKIISYDGPATQSERRALDLYILGFALMGMNEADFYSSGTIKGDILCYERKKTKNHRWDRAYMEIKIDPRIRPLVDRYIDRTNNRAFRFYQIYKNCEALEKMVQIGLKNWAARVGVERFNFYSCRHSWGTIARSSACKVEKSLADECLNHSSHLPLADVYIEKDWEMIWEANKKVLDLFEWPSSWPEPKLVRI